MTIFKYFDKLLYSTVDGDTDFKNYVPRVSWIACGISAIMLGIVILLGKIAWGRKADAHCHGMF